jgi:hypothetical protein
VLQEDFYNAYLNSGVAFRSQRVCSLEAIVATGGEQVCPHLTFLPGLVDLLGGSAGMLLVGSESSMPPYGLTSHRYIHFTFRGCDHRLYNTRARKILRIPESATRIH